MAQAGQGVEVEDGGSLGPITLTTLSQPHPILVHLSIVELQRYQSPTAHTPRGATARRRISKKGTATLSSRNFISALVQWVASYEAYAASVLNTVPLHDCCPVASCLRQAPVIIYS